MMPPASEAIAPIKAALKAVRSHGNIFWCCSHQFGGCCSSAILNEYYFVKEVCRSDYDKGSVLNTTLGFQVLSVAKMVDEFIVAVR